MHFDILTQDLPDPPSFTVARFRDFNPVSGLLKMRTIGMPNGSMRVVHERLMKRLRRIHAFLPHATCYRKRDSAVKNALPHKGNRYFYLLDLRNAYGTVNIARLARLLFNRDIVFWDYRIENTLHFLQCYCCFSPASTGQARPVNPLGVVIGAPASPVLFNVYAGILIDEALGSLCQKHGMTYTRYIDDLTFSSRKKIGTRVRKQIRAAIVGAGFVIHDRKAKLIDLRKQGSVVITGVGLHVNGTIFVPRRYLRLLRGFIHKALTDQSISTEMVEGRMGVFRAIMHTRKPNQTESKLIALYQEWRRRVKYVRDS